MTVTAEVDADVPLPRDRVWTWWTDFRSDGHDALRFRLLGFRDREILDRDDDGRPVRMRDRASLLGWTWWFDEEILAYQAPERLRVEAEWPIGHAESVFAFEETGAGTRIRWTLELDPRGRWRWLTRPWVLRRVMRYDLEGHATELRQDLDR